jgi:FkbM family methyltransferase
MRAHADRVLKGEYALPAGYSLDGVKTVLDIGGNVGAFAMWAAGQWPSADIVSFEPSPENYALLTRNTEGLRVAGIAVAVGDSNDTATTFYVGKNNCGETSRHDLGEQDLSRTFVADVVPASSLADCDVLKVDTEGCELSILESYFLKSRVSLPLVVMLEWHRPGDRWRIGALLTGQGYECVRDDVRRADRGVQTWVQA